LEDYRGRAEDLFRPFPFFTTERGVLLAHINTYDGVPVQLHMTRPARPQPVRVRHYTDPIYHAPLQWGEPSELLSKLRSFDADVHRALGKPQPRGLAMIRRIAWLARLSKTDGFDDFLQDTYMRIAEGSLQEDPLDPSSENPSENLQRTQKRAAPIVREVARPAQMTLDFYTKDPKKPVKSDQIYGCSKCRYSARGCVRCRSPDFKGYRGPRPDPAESGAP
jgi:hypothetical protein